MSLLRTKPLAAILRDPDSEQGGLKRALGGWDLVAIGIGCIIGVGIFVLPGVEAAKHAGPGIILSFAIAAAACACAALCYAELAAMIPVAGSAYTYGYATLGEVFAWIIGWDLILEYIVAAWLVSIGWSSYFCNLVNTALGRWQLEMPAKLASAPLVWDATANRFHATGAIVNLPAVAIVAVLTLLLVRGIKESARVNSVMVVIKLGVIVLFIAAAVWHVEPANWKPFMPFGLSGVTTAAAIVFLAFVGFDAVSTAAEEARNPQRDMPIGIMGSLAVATVLYMGVSAIMTGVVPYTELGVADPVALVLNVLDMKFASALVSVGAITGITSVLLVLLLAQPRIFFAMSRDGLLPAAMSRVHPRFRTPVATTVVTGVVVAVGAALLPIDVVAELCSIGTLFAFMIVSAGVIVLRFTRKDLHRPFRVPLFPLTPALGLVLCGGLMLRLPLSTWIRFGGWLAIGLLIYSTYSYRHSKLSATAR
ncbi:MAG TPA: amino acid permease [Thermoanaerobaculaceae bacterium]|nr:amino acid permease [Thermoanaerobaculaceae bacterium]HRS15506.1 amino acid permease [Thermoanaerobaculaceae bacterium]